ncbi:hypothetical protein SAMN06273572_10553 [Monaibacterium marinum]|uniref:LPS-assembly lipoprotein n=1 Tax=Pontivivens marinum TaxID=1690039 RepID=A0A2C9CTU4_9RHOB|nr:hypothetical protein [Monaibacterium marinum]SOH94633.1 hypothetical protein SAMN06273572_10553 [Monaibacterium marinum]
MLRRVFICGLAVLPLMGCGQPGLTEYVTPALDAPTIRAVTFSGATVDTRALREQFDTPDFNSATVRTEVLDAAERELIWDIGGTRATRVELIVTDVRFDGNEAGLFGQGVAVMRGTVSLVDATTGAVIVAPTEIFSPGIGWVADGNQPDITQADRGTELTELAEQFVARARRVLLGA